jgi:hypothetical protein
VAKPPTSNIPPRRKGGAPAKSGGRPAVTPVAARPPRKPTARRRRGMSRGRMFALIGGAIVVIVAVIVAIVLATGGSSSSTHTASAVNYTTASGVKVYGTLGPEHVPLQLGPELGPANSSLTSAPVDGIQCNAGEQLTYHHHVHLAIFINGKPMSVPLGIGMVPPAIVQKTSAGAFAEGSNTCLFWLHVHAQDGIVHIESPTSKIYRLGQFFNIWGQSLSSTQVGTYKGAVTATVNGKPWTGDPTQIPLVAYTQIVLNVGGPTVTPPPISWSGTGL